MVRTLAVLAAAAIALGACSGDESGACAAGEERVCPCLGGGEGTQSCNSSGTGYEPCSGCGLGGAAGSSGSGGADGGGSGGSGGAGTGGGGAGGSGASGGTGGATGKRTGLVQLDGRSLSDDQGRFNALGATLMWAAWGYKNDLGRLEQNLDHLAKNGFHYVRALGVVGDPVAADYWDGREIDWHWPDYAAVIAGFTDLAWDKYGLRVEWTLIGDGQLNIPSSSDRQALVDTFLAMSLGREQKIIHFEIANEAWQNGFDGAAGITELRALSQYMKDQTPILVAASAPASGDCAGAQEIYAGGVADLATIHFDRDIGQTEGHWRPVWQPWWMLECLPALPVGSNNEPIGPGASVSTEDDPLKLVAGALSTYLSGLPLHVFHSSAGVRGDQDLWQMAGSDAFGQLAALVPPDLASWDRKDPKQGDAPLRVWAQDGGQPVADALWPELGAPTAGAVRAYAATSGKDFFSVPIGILSQLEVEARVAVTFDVWHPLTGAKLATHSLAPGQKAVLTGAEALVLRGTLD